MITTNVSTTEVVLSVGAAVQPAVNTTAATSPTDVAIGTSSALGSHPADIHRITAEESNLLNLLARDVERFRARKQIVAKVRPLTNQHRSHTNSRATEDRAASIDALLADEELATNDLHGLRPWVNQFDS